MSAQRRVPKRNKYTHAVDVGIALRLKRNQDCALIRDQARCVKKPECRILAGAEAKRRCSSSGHAGCREHVIRAASFTVRGKRVAASTRAYTRAGSSRRTNLAAAAVVCSAVVDRYTRAAARVVSEIARAAALCWPGELTVLLAASVACGTVVDRVACWSR